MHEIQSQTAPIPYQHYRAEAARLRSEAIRAAFQRLGRFFRGRARQGAQGYGALSGAGCGQ